jgi:hypothetical protein
MPPMGGVQVGPIFFLFQLEEFGVEVLGPFFFWGHKIPIIDTSKTMLLVVVKQISQNFNVLGNFILPLY